MCGCDHVYQCWLFRSSVVRRTRAFHAPGHLQQRRNRHRGRLPSQSARSDRAASIRQPPPRQFEPTAIDPGVIGILLTDHVIDKPRIFAVEAAQARHQVALDDQTLTVTAHGVAVAAVVNGRAANGDLDAKGVDSPAGRGDELDQAADRVRSVQRALRTFQDFDLSKIRRIDVRRDLAAVTVSTVPIRPAPRRRRSEVDGADCERPVVMPRMVSWVKPSLDEVIDSAQAPGPHSPQTAPGRLGTGARAFKRGDAGGHVLQPSRTASAR